MARILNQVAGKIVKEYNNLTQDSEGVLTGPLNKLWRARILLNRALSQYSKDKAHKSSITNPNFPSEYPGITNNEASHLRMSYDRPDLNQKAKKDFRIEVQMGNGIFSKDSYSTLDPAEGSYSDEKKDSYTILPGYTNLNKVIIFNLSVSPYQYIELQNRPTTIDFRGETTWATIKSMGRNTPMYHYTGSEDVIQFNISWYCNDPDNPEEVLYKCRLLESWTKSNGYQAGPPLLKISFGTSHIFEDHIYILTSATYSLNNFRNLSRKREYQGLQPVQELQNLKLTPSTATQELIFKRVSAYSLSHNDILPQSYKDTLLKSGSLKSMNS